MGHTSASGLLVLHAVRIRGFADSHAVARRFALDPEDARELLLDFEALGWVRHSRFADSGGWSLTERGRAENERLLRDEVEATGVRAAVSAAHDDFAKLNARFLKTITDWQVRPTPWDPLARNDHTDFRWDDRVLDALGGLGRRLRPVCTALADSLDRFDGYADRFSTAYAKVERGERSWVDRTGVDSCHTVWFELHEDLLATLGIERGSE